MIKPFLVALQFLTRYPVWLNEQPKEQELGLSVIYFPVIGLLLGLFLLLIANILVAVHASVSIAAALILTVWVLSTGGLHLDGLADSVDAWSGGRGDHERTLAIMKEPQCGAMAIIAVCLLLILKYSALNAILGNKNIQLIVIAPILGRVVLPLLFLLIPYIRPQGTGAAMANHLPRKLAVFVVSTVCAGIVFYYDIAGLLAVLAGTVVFLFQWHKMSTTIGGSTGDTAGALVELVEAVSLLTIGL